MEDLHALILEATGACALISETPLQRLWGGYGQISRLVLQGGTVPSAVLKRVSPPPQTPARESAFSHLRKLRSYAVEQAWYRTWAQRCAADCRVPRCYGVETQGDELWLLLEDLDAAGFSGRWRVPGPEQQAQVLRWLAHFHALFLGSEPLGLWPEGSYWQLQTRPQEWADMPSGPLKAQAAALDARLRTARFRTLIHGDPKPANFCFGASGVAAVDFQYVGGGCGMRDVAYWLSCCAGPWGARNATANWVDSQLDLYFDALQRALPPSLRQSCGAALEQEWRALFAVAWTDFGRFLAGWQGGTEPDAFSQGLAAQVLSGEAV
ncbi:MAG: phosphotransferase [Candidatus Sericytochromatia bacterium]